MAGRPGAHRELPGPLADGIPKLLDQVELAIGFGDNDREILLVDDTVGVHDAVRPGEGVLPHPHPGVAVHGLRAQGAVRGPAWCWVLGVVGCHPPSIGHHATDGRRGHPYAESRCQLPPARRWLTSTACWPPTWSRL